MPAGSGLATMYYTDTISGTATLTFADRVRPDLGDLGLGNAHQDVGISAGAPTRLHLTGQATAISGQPASMVLHMENAYGGEVTSAADTELAFG